MFVQKRKEKKGAISFGKGQGCILPKKISWDQGYFKYYFSLMFLINEIKKIAH